jgi:DNA-binding XRE family transcriptional regulator
MKNPLKVLRAERNWTQADLADAPGCVAADYQRH